MQHLDEGTIHSWLDGALSADEAARVEAHVKECRQCAAAVAEARGFIAASSRILTALDNAPRGVTPASVPKRRFDPIIWRVAASVLVVAAGTLVVLQNRGGDESPMSISSDGALQVPQPTSVPERVSAGAAAPIAPAPAGAVETRTGQAVTGSAAIAAATSAPNRTLSKAPAIALRGTTGVANQRADMNARERRALEEPAAASIGQRDSAASNYAEAAGRAAVTMRPMVAAGAVAKDAAAEPERLKVVGTTPRALGVKITLYEVAPGDTVTLTEPMPLSLNQVVVTGAAGAPIRRENAKTMAPQSVARADAAAAAAPDSQVAAAVEAAPPSAQPLLARAPVRQAEVANGVTTISWTDATTGKVLKLSGRMPEVRLQQIKVRIERERAAAAAKKNP
jgi:anti-sigma factor RsiW